MGTAFKVYITDIYLPHIENEKISNARNLRYHGNNTIILPKIRMKHHFRAKFLLAENQMSRFTIQHLVNTCQTKKLRLWLKFYVTMETKNRLSVDIPFVHVIWKAVYLLSATVHINGVYKLEIIHIKSSHANKKLTLGFRYYGNPNVRRSASTHKTIFKGKVSSFTKCVYEKYLQSLNKRNLLFQK